MCNDGVWSTFLVATRTIEKGECICLNYGEEYWRNMVSNFVLDSETEKIARHYLDEIYDEKMNSGNHKRKNSFDY